MAYTMQNCLHKALERVTLTGAQGIDVETLYAEALPTLPKWMKQKVWRNLVSRYGDVLFHQGRGDGGASTVLAKDCTELESYESAVSAKVVLSPSSDLYDALLGVYGNSLLRFGFSNSQKAALLLLVRAGSKGMAQNELAQQVGVRNNNAHYVIKSLSERNLIFRRKANVKMETAKGMVSVSTHYVYLSKFQNADEQNGGVKPAEDALAGQADVGSASRQIVATEYVNDRLIFHKVIQELENSSQNIAIEAYLKVSLGFEYVSGHRSWRRIRGIMERLGLIEVFQGITDNNKTEKFIRLLKTLDDIDKRDSTSIGPMTLFDRPVRSTGSQVFDMSLDRQIILALAKAGGDGMTSADLDALLSLNLKRNSQRLTEIYERYTDSKLGELKTDTVNCGRSILKRYTFSRALADEMLGVCHAKVSTDVPPEPPQGGWLQAVNRASAFMLSEKDLEEVLNKGEGEKTVTESNAVPAEEPVPETTLSNRSRGKLKTEIAKRRKEWLVEAVLEQKFILGSEAGSIILDKEKAAGFLGATSIDKKMYMRAASTAQEEKLIDILTIQVPNQSGTTGTQTQLVFIPHDTQFGDDLFQAAIERYQNNFKSKQPFKDSNKVTQENLPRVSGLIKVTNLEEKRNRSNESYQIALKNGYNQSKLHRCQILADSIWQFIDNRPPGFHDPAVSEFWKKLSEQNIFVFSRQHEPKKDNRQIKMSRFDLTEQNQRFLFNVEEIWRNLTVTDFLRALGSTCENQEILESHRGKKIGQLDMTMLINLAGGRKGYSTAQKHFSHILDMLHRMGFIKAILPHGKMHSSRLEGTLFMANPVVIHESLADSPGNFEDSNAVKSKIVKEFNVMDPSQREGYWISLQYLFYTYPKKGNEPNILQAQTCFPLDRAPEAINDKGYASKNDCDEKDIEKARLHILQNIATRQWGDMPWERVKALSENINVPHEAVIKAVSRLRKKKDTKRLDGLVTSLKKKEKEIPKKKKERVKADIQSPAVNTIEEEEEEAELVMLQPESSKPPTRKRNWYEGEDRKLLHAWISWLCQNGKGKMLVWKHVKNRPMSVKWHSCRNRITRLMQDSDVNEYMKVIKDECELVFQRHTQNVKQKAVAKKMAKKNSGQNLFEVRDEADLASSQKILKHVEKVVQSAPMRHSESLDVALIFESSKYRRKSLRSSWNPIDAYLWLRSSSRRSKLSGESGLPGVELTAAIAMIISYLYALEFEGQSSDEITQDLESRFSCDTLKNALKLLAQNELVTFEVTERQNVEILLFCLTDRFKAELKPPLSPGLPWLDSTGFLGLDKGRLWSLPHIVRMEGGALPLLNVGIMGGANFHIIMPSFTGSQSSVAPDSGEVFLRQDLASVHLKNPKEVTSAIKTKGRDKKSVKYTPKEVLRSLKAYNEAREAFLADMKVIINVSAANSILEMITKAGPPGLPRSSLKEFLELNKISVDVATLENLLSHYGICRVMNGFNETYMLSTEVSNHLIFEKATSYGSSKEVTMEVPIRPWFNNKGQLLKTFWKMLVSRILDVVSRFPGADGDILCQSLRILVAPKFCQEVIQILCKSDVLYFEYFPRHDRFTKGIFSAALTYSEPLQTEAKNSQSEADRLPFSSGSVDEYYFFLNPIKSLGALDVVPSCA